MLKDDLENVKYLEVMADNYTKIFSFLKLEISSKGIYEKICGLLYVLFAYVTGNNTEAENNDLPVHINWKEINVFIETSEYGFNKLDNYWFMLDWEIQTCVKESLNKDTLSRKSPNDKGTIYICQNANQKLYLCQP